MSKSRIHVFIVEGEIDMPVRKLNINGETFYQWGQSGKMYKNKADADRQGTAILAQGYKKKPRPRPKQ
jgi:hypothetical protein